MMTAAARTATMSDDDAHRLAASLREANDALHVELDERAGEIARLRAELEAVKAEARNPSGQTVERVARAITRAEGHDPNAIWHDDSGEPLAAWTWRTAEARAAVMAALAQPGARQGEAADV